MWIYYLNGIVCLSFNEFVFKQGRFYLFLVDFCFKTIKRNWKTKFITLMYNMEKRRNS